MRKNKWYLALILGTVLTVGITGCQNSTTPAAETENEAEQKPEKETEEKQTDKEETEEKDKDTKEEEKKEEPEAGQESQEEEEEQSEETSEAAPVENSKAIIYIPTANAEGWDVKQVEIEQVTADALIGQLVGAGVLADSVTVQNFEETEDEGRYVLNLDLSPNFRDSILSMGSAGETLTIGALVNSFLDTYQAEAISITVDGQILESGHVSYEGYLQHINY